MQGLFVFEFSPSPDESESVSVFHHVLPFELEEPERCKHCQSPIRNPMRVPPLRYEIRTEGKGVGDFVFGPGAGVLVSNSFREGFVDSKLKGVLEFIPVEITRIRRGSKNLPIENTYFQLRISRVGRICYQASELEDEAICNICLSSRSFKRIRRVVLEPNSWSENDIFIPFGTISTVVTSSAFREMCLSKCYSNAVFIPAEKYSLDFYPWEKSRKFA